MCGIPWRWQEEEEKEEGAAQRYGTVYMSSCSNFGKLVVNLQVPGVITIHSLGKPNNVWAYIMPYSFVLAVTNIAS